MSEPRAAQDRLPARDPPYPRTILAAGIVWIIFGCLILLNVLLHLVAALNAMASKIIEVTAGLWLVPVPVLFGSVSIYIGIQSVRGTARDTLGRGIGSILLGLSKVACASDIVNALGGLSLLAAGALALYGRPEYKDWRHAQSVRSLPRLESWRPNESKADERIQRLDGRTDIQTEER